MEIARTAASFLPRLPSSVNGGSLTGDPLRAPYPAPPRPPPGLFTNFRQWGVLRSSRQGFRI